MTLHNKHNLRLFLIIIATTFYFLANIQRVAIPGAIFNLLQNDFSASASKITMLGAIFCYTYALTQLVVGLMVDKLGGFRVVALGSVAFALGSVIFPNCNSIILLYLSRILVGFGAATFYLSAIREVKKFAKDKNFSLAVSYILFIGYSGGIIANAPLVSAVNNIGWVKTFSMVGFFTLTLCLIYLISLYIFKPVKIENETKFSLEPFSEVLANKNNINLYIFGSFNYGLYYVLQSVIGKKFLEDFCLIATSKAALVLSVMALISAFAGTITACISRLINNRRAIIFKTYAILSFLTILTVFVLLIFNFQTKLIAIILCIPAFIGSISPLLILTLHLMNRYEISATAVAIQNFGFFMMVGILGMVTGMIMNLFEPIVQQGSLIYPKNAYLSVFGLFLIIAVVEVVCAFRTKDKYN